MSSHADQIRAIDTTWNNQLFRSRLEARWAVFYDVLDIPYHYEPQTFYVGQCCYIPDFYLPNQDCWIEIKPKQPTIEEERKIYSVASIVKRDVYCFFTSPKIPTFADESAHVYSMLPVGEDKADGLDPDHFMGWDSRYYWCECPNCGRLDIRFEGRADRIGCNCPKSPHGDKGYNFESTKLVYAYRKAAFERFGAY